MKQLKHINGIARPIGLLCTMVMILLTSFVAYGQGKKNYCEFNNANPKQCVTVTQCNEPLYNATSGKVGQFDCETQNKKCICVFYYGFDGCVKDKNEKTKKDTRKEGKRDGGGFGSDRNV